VGGTSRHRFREPRAAAGDQSCVLQRGAEVAHLLVRNDLALAFPNTITRSRPWALPHGVGTTTTTSGNRANADDHADSRGAGRNRGCPVLLRGLRSAG
jgi:hypothetical protein